MATAPERARVEAALFEAEKARLAYSATRDLLAAQMAGLRAAAKPSSQALPQDGKVRAIARLLWELGGKPDGTALADEDFQAFGLTFGGGATMVLTGHTTATPQKYVTVIAQPDFYGKAQILLKQVTTDNSLDVIPRMRARAASDRRVAAE